YADGYAERLPTLAKEVVGLKPDVILAPATGQAVAAKRATRTIPIVTAALADAVHLGLVESDARPGGNVTGLTPYVEGLPAKQLELAREVVPGASRIGVLNDADGAGASDRAGAPAGASDITARLMGQWLSKRLGQQFVIDNRPGANNIIGTEAVVRAPADGYTLLMVGTAQAINATLYDNLNFNFIRDIAPVADIIRTALVVVVH